MSKFLIIIIVFYKSYSYSKEALEEIKENRVCPFCLKQYDARQEIFSRIVRHIAPFLGAARGIADFFRSLTERRELP